MINLITGYNNTGKTTWIADTITDRYNVCCKFLWVENDGYVNRITSTKLDSDDYIRESELRYVPKNYTDKKEDYNNCELWMGYFHSDLAPVIYYNQPENGLHPSLHSNVVEEVIKLHNQGYDIYIETHSDHIVNATRVAIKQGLIKPEDVKVLFFKAIDDFVEIKINERGRFVNETPKGFCDQHRINLGKLL
jgi:hypothetical protein